MIKKDQDDPALQSVEFWSTICEEEIYLDEEEVEARQSNITPARRSQKFIQGALKFLAPVLLEALLKQPDDPDDDEWNIATASGIFF